MRPRDMAGQFRGRGAEVGDALTGRVGLSAARRGKHARGAGPAVAWPSWAKARAVAWRGRRRSCWAGRGCWAGDAEACGCWAESGGWAGLSGEGERRVNGPRRKKAMQAETKEGEEIFIFQQIFPKAFSNYF